MSLLIDFTVIAILIIGICQFREPHKAKNGNLIAAIALFLALILVLYRNGIIDVGTVVTSMMIGSIAGFALARAVNMIQVPAMVAFQHGAGGVAAFLVAFVELSRTSHSLSLVSEISGVLGLVIGSLTFSGSMIASAKLANKMNQAPQILTYHNTLVGVNTLALLAIGTMSLLVPHGIAIYLFILEICLGISFGIFLSMRIGGADMPVLISSLNATAGLAASLCGMVIENQLLIAFGATVAASGSILTYVMCKAMNRDIVKVVFPNYAVQKNAIDPLSAPTSFQMNSVGIREKSTSTEQLQEAISAMRAAKTIIIVPGYGMALAKAQHDVAKLAQKFIAMGKDVKYAIHPVAGRMPGHINVLLAEAGVDYDMLVEMDVINSNFAVTDLALVVGACDVVNPAAINVEGTPISGMPILKAYEAGYVVCCNFDSKPGYSGIANSIYERDNVVLLSGDAKNTITNIIEKLPEAQSELDSLSVLEVDDSWINKASELLSSAKNVIIIPGYGMALAKAQFKLVELANLLEGRGVKVKYAIHPVAGRMPGHMNVLLAEADVEYDNLLEMDDANPLFKDTDVTLVVGACDVVNPAAIEREGTPISGMPILLAHNAKNVIVCNFDARPGYSGVPNPLYDNLKTILLPGDASETLTSLVAAL